MLMVVKLFLNGIIINYIWKRAHVIKHSHGRFVVGAFDKKCMKDLFGIEKELLYTLSCTNQYSLIFYTMELSL